jgi:AraC-like DNA-binding protein
MAFLSVLSPDSAVELASGEALGADCAVARVGSWPRLLTLVAERPATGVVLDSELLEGEGGADRCESALVELATRFPSLWVVLVARPSIDPLTLFRLGRRGIRSLVLARLEVVHLGVVDAIRGAVSTSTESLVTSAFSAYLPARENRAVRLALRGAQLGWGADELAVRSGLTRAHMSVRLRAVGLPTAGHLLVWAKLLHAGRWLSDPGRSGESVSRQLDYSSGAAFRRALRNYVGATPGQIRAQGGLAPILSSFGTACGIEPTTTGDRSAA